MTFTPFLAGCLGMILATSALAEPYCAPMLEADALERRYQRLAPIYNSAETGWIFASDQLDYRYVLSATEQALLADLVSELAARGTVLAMLIAPPRPVVAGQDVVDATTGQPGIYDMAAQGAAFQAMIAQIVAAGAIAPDLLRLVQSQPSLADRFYFRRDTHWTNLGAAHSAQALAEMINAEWPAFDPAGLTALEMAEEPGSLSRIVTATCGVTPAAETSPLFDYTPHLPQSAGLLSDTEGAGARTVLLGTSFSNRYGRDQYQAADALAAALGRPIDNRSVSGGGMIGPFETYILTGAFAENPPALLIWEFPYTYQLREGDLRRLLGALRADGPVAATGPIPLGAGATRIDLPDDLGERPVLGLRMTEGLARDLVVRLHFEDGSDARLRLRRKSRMDAVAVLDTWWIDLRFYETPLVAVSLEPRGDTDLRAIDLLLPAISG